MTLLIRSARDGDLDAVTRVYADAVRTGTASYEIDPPDRREIERRLRALSEQGFPVLAAESEGRFLGYAYAGPFRPRPAYRFTVEDSIYVDASARGRGVGRALLTRLVAACETSGFRQMVAVIGDGVVNEASVALHASLGFRPAGRLEGSGFKHGRWLDTVLMQRALNGGTDTPPTDA